jgi:hypothetical protein
MKPCFSTIHGNSQPEETQNPDPVDHPNYMDGETRSISQDEPNNMIYATQIANLKQTLGNEDKTWKPSQYEDTRGAEGRQTL